MRHLFVVDSLDPLIQNEKELIHPVSAGGRGLFCICVESINLNLNLIKVAYRLYIFRTSRFDNRKYFKIDKRVCLREICVEIDHFPIQPFHCCTALPQSSPSNKNLFFVLTLSKYRKWPSFLYARPKSNNFLPTFCFLIPLEKGFHSKSKNKKQKRGSKFVFCRL